MVCVQVWGAAEINLGYELSEGHKRVLLRVLKVCRMFPRYAWFSHASVVAAI